MTSAYLDQILNFINGHGGRITRQFILDHHGSLIHNTEWERASQLLVVNGFMTIEAGEGGGIITLTPAGANAIRYGGMARKYERLDEATAAAEQARNLAILALVLSVVIILLLLKNHLS